MNGQAAPWSTETGTGFGARKPGRALEHGNRDGFEFLHGDLGELDTFDVEGSKLLQRRFCPGCGLSSGNGDMTCVAIVDDLTIRSWNTNRVAFDVVEHVDTFDVDGDGRNLLTAQLTHGLETICD